MLVFCNTHGTVDHVVAKLRAEEFHVGGLHGEKAAGHRSAVMDLFRAGAGCSCLVVRLR